MVLWSCLVVLAVLAKASAMPLFLFSGQSNMEGHSTSGASAGGNAMLFEEIVAILNSDGTEMEKEALLEASLLKVQASNPVTANFEARSLLELANRGLLENIISPMANAFCSYVIPDGTVPATTPLLPATNVAAYAGCGRVFGHELIFAHSLASMGEPWSSQDFSIPKVARGGTEIHRDWSPTNGLYWPALNHTIHNTDGEWKAFVWHQGENDCFVPDEKSIYYQQNLTALVANVRTEMFRAGSSYPSAGDIPVVIVELGTWPANAAKARIVESQRNFVANDNNAVIVKTNDLSGFYHYDAASLLIIGDRIAQQLAPLVATESTPTTLAPQPTPPPTPPPTPFPTSPPTLAPTSPPTPPPTLGPTPLPTSPPTLQPMEITNFVLVDSISNEDIDGGFSCTPACIGSASKFDIRAETSGPVQSVKLSLTGPKENVRVENVAPYAAFGDISGDYFGFSLPPGSYTVFAQPFSLPGANGSAGPVQSLNFTIPSPPTASPTPAPVSQPTPVPSLRPTKAPTPQPTTAPTSSIGISKFVLVDAATDLDVPEGFNCTPSACVDSATNFNIRAETFGDVKSVHLRLTGGLFADRVENFPPFAVFGDISGVYFGKELPSGTYTIKAEAYPLPDAGGTPSPAKTFQFMIA